MTCQREVAFGGDVVHERAHPIDERLVRIGAIQQAIAESVLIDDLVGVHGDDQVGSGCEVPIQGGVGELGGLDDLVERYTNVPLVEQSLSGGDERVIVAFGVRAAGARRLMDGGLALRGQSRYSS